MQWKNTKKKLQYNVSHFKIKSWYFFSIDPASQRYFSRFQNISNTSAYSYFDRVVNSTSCHVICGIPTQVCLPYSNPLVSLLLALAYWFWLLFYWSLKKQFKLLVCFVFLSYLCQKLVSIIFSSSILRRFERMHFRFRLDRVINHTVCKTLC